MSRFSWSHYTDRPARPASPQGDGFTFADVAPPAPQHAPPIPPAMPQADGEP